MPKVSNTIGEPEDVAELAHRASGDAPVSGDARVSGGAPELGFSPAEFQSKLSKWYREHARDLPWRGVDDPYATWLSEIMLQQTRVETVTERYKEFLLRFPTIRDLAVADEADVLALWSGLGYYRRARMLLRGAQFVEREMQGKLPRTVAELRTLPGVGEYTAAAIASIAFGDSVAVLDGNVERVLLRVLGEPEERSGKARTRLVEIAQMLVPAAKRTRGSRTNPPGDHNQAMMELGATVCLPRSPLCLQCPVFDLCRTRGEHVTGERTRMLSRSVAYLLAVRKRGIATEVLLERRDKDASLMAGMMELPEVPMEATVGREPVLRVRHAITVTNFYVQVFSEGVLFEGEIGELRDAVPENSLVRQIRLDRENLEWVETTRLTQLPLTGLARKVLLRLQMISMPRANFGNF